MKKERKNLMVAVVSRKRICVLCGVLLAAFSLFAESASVDSIKEGKDLFAAGAYDKAILVFRNVILDPAADSEKGDAYFWTAKAYMALGKADEAERNLEVFLSGWQDSTDFPEALYQKDRLLLQKDEFENAIQVLQTFLTAYGRSPLVPNAYFWVGECLYGLGRMDDALKLYRKVLQDFPTSYKVEAAQYKVSLIGLRQREIELAKLLKWSHEDFLKSIEEFQKREKTYEQTIESYQKKLAVLEAAQYQKTIQDQKKDLEKKTAEIARLTEQWKTANSELEKFKAVPTGSTVAVDSTRLSELERDREKNVRTLKMLALKQEVLLLKEKYLTWLDSNREAQ
jgi:tetratricopeptide (TPR) repeat protein